MSPLYPEYNGLETEGEAAEIVIQRLLDAGFEIKPAERHRP